MEYLKLLEGLNEANCNGRIEKLTELQKQVSRKYEVRYNNGISNVDDLDAEYNQTQDVMEQLTSFRRSHNCLMLGDKGYIPCVTV